MHSINCYEYISVGLDLRILRYVKSSALKKSVKNTITQLAEGLKEINFSVSLAYLDSTSYSRMMKLFEDLQDTDQIGDDLKGKVKLFSERLEPVVFAEACTKTIYVLPERRFNTDILLNKPDNLLANGIYERLDDIARIDISSSCKCILFGEATAAAFHILRATESVLKRYYFIHRQRKRLEKPMWGPMIEQLRAKTRNKPPSVLLDSLDVIRLNYRNPTQHPQAIYTIDSAQDLLGVCLDVIGKMALEMEAS